MAPGLTLHEALAQPGGLLASMLARIALFTLLSFPLALAFRSMPAGVPRHAASAFVGALALWLVASAQHLFHVVVITLLSYAVVRLAPARYAGGLTFAMCFWYVLAVHSARAELFAELLGPAAVGSARASFEAAFCVREFQTAVMAASLKAAGFALSLSEGTHASPADSSQPMHRAHAAQRLNRPPSMLRYFGYMLFFPAVLGHPTFFSYAEYEAACAEPNADRCCPSAPTARRDNELPPVAWVQVLVRMLEGVCFGLVHMQAPRFLPRCSAGHYEPAACYASSILSLAKFYVRAGLLSPVAARLALPPRPDRLNQVPMHARVRAPPAPAPQAFWRLTDGPIVIAGLLPSDELSAPHHFTRMRTTLFAPDFALAVRSWNLPVARFMKVRPPRLPPLTDGTRHKRSLAPFLNQRPSMHGCLRLPQLLASAELARMMTNACPHFLLPRLSPVAPAMLCLLAKVHVFLRAPRPVAPLVTFVFSALWHGVAVGYCVAAASALLFVQTSGALHARLAPRAAAWPALARWCFYGAGRALSHLAAAFTFLPMMTVSSGETLAMLRALRFAPYWVSAALLALCAAVGPAPAHMISSKKNT